MPGRKRNWNAGTPLRYRMKVARVLRGIATTPEIAEQLADVQTRVWEGGSALYRQIRAIAKDVMSKPDTFVSPAARAQYYAAISFYYKQVMVLGKSPDAVRAYLEASFENVDFRIFDAILDALTGAGIAVRKPAERATA
jgi:hypothetical protein